MRRVAFIADENVERADPAHAIGSTPSAEEVAVRCWRPERRPGPEAIDSALVSTAGRARRRVRDARERPPEESHPEHPRRRPIGAREVLAVGRAGRGDLIASGGFSRWLR
jgi:hypothetical protein